MHNAKENTLTEQHGQEELSLSGHTFAVFRISHVLHVMKPKTKLSKIEIQVKVILL